MKFSISKWFAYTLLVGLIPVLARLLVWTTAANDLFQPVVATDLIALGLVLHTSCINEIAHLPEREGEWKTLQIGLSITFIAMYGTLYTLAIIGDKVDAAISEKAVLASSFIIANISTFVSLVVLHRLSKRGRK